MKRIFTCLLGCLLCAGLLGCVAIHGVSSFNQYPDAEKYSVGNFSYTAEGITRVEVDWVAGSIHIKQSDKTTLQVEETGELTEEQQLHYLLEGGVLKIQYCVSGYTGTFPAKGKELTVEIPQGIDLSVDSVSGDVELGDGSFGELKLDITSGEMGFGRVSADTCKLDTVSGGVRGEALLCERWLKADTTSGEVGIDRLECPHVDVGTTSGNINLCLYGQEAEIETTSGSILLKLEQGKSVEVESTSGSVTVELGDNLGGATVDFDSTSGALHADGYVMEQGCCIFGGGSCEIQVETTSGSLTVK